MPARDTYYIDMTVTGEYDDAPTWRSTHSDYMSPGQDRSVVMANLLRSAALELAPEEGDVRSDVAIYAALDKLRATCVMSARASFPATRQLQLDLLWAVADALNLDWYGVRHV